MGGWGHRSRRGRQRACRDCHSTLNVRGWCAQARVAVRRVCPGALRPEWQCDGCARVRSGPSGSADHTAKWRRAYRNGTLRPEWQCDRYARGRVAVRITLPLAGERTEVERSGPSGSATGALRPEWQCGSHCHSPVNVRRLNAQGRVAVRQVRPGTLRVEWQCGPGPFVDLRALHRHGDGSPDGSLRVTRPSFTDQDSLLANQADR